jgi:hypothetical protein
MLHPSNLDPALVDHRRLVVLYPVYPSLASIFLRRRSEAETHLVLLYFFFSLWKFCCTRVTEDVPEI